MGRLAGPRMRGSARLLARAPAALATLAALAACFAGPTRAQRGGASNGAPLGAAVPYAGGDLRAVPKLVKGDGAAPGSLCAHTAQGMLQVVDDRGTLCDLAAVDPSTGCCAAEHASSKKHLCDSCDQSTSCCNDYEGCVSCCMGALESMGAGEPIAAVSPHHPAMWRRWLIHRDSEAKGGADGEAGGVASTFSVAAWPYCTMKCRANAHTTKNENTYRSYVHHCFGDKASDDDTPRWHQEELASRKSKHPNAGNPDGLAKQGGDFLLQKGTLAQLVVQQKGSRRAIDATGADAARSAASGILGGGHSGAASDPDLPVGVSTAAIKTAQAGGTLIRSSAGSTGSGGHYERSFGDAAGDAYRRIGMSHNALPMTILLGIFGSLCCLMCICCVCGEDFAAVFVESN